MDTYSFFGVSLSNYIKHSNKKRRMDIHTYLQKIKKKKMKLLRKMLLF